MLYVLTQPKSLPEKYQPRPSFLDLTPLRYPLWLELATLWYSIFNFQFSIIMSLSDLPKLSTTSSNICSRGPFLYYVRVKGWVGGIAKYLLFLTGVGGWFWITLT